MSSFPNFITYLSNEGILLPNHRRFLPQKPPYPQEGSEFILALTNFFKSLDSNDFFQIASSLYQKFLSTQKSEKEETGYLKDLDFFRSIIGGKSSQSAKKNTKNEKVKNSKINSSNEKSEKFDRLYSDSLHKEEFMKMKQESYMKGILKECTFVPEINQNKIISDKLKVPVFERLSKQTVKSYRDVPESQKETVELQECTFRPQILKYILASNNAENEAKAFQRLYENAENIRQNIKIKKQNIEETAEKELNFVPEINESSNRIMSKKRAEDKATPYDRLYQISVDKRSQIRDCDPMKNDEIECTFHPETFYTDDYQKRSRILQETKSSNIFTRLYQQNRNDSEKKPQKDEKNKKNRETKDETPVFNKLYNERHLRSKKHEQIQKDYYKEIGATFKPKINERKKSPLSKSLIREQNSKKIMSKSLSAQSLKFNSSEKKDRKNNNALVRSRYLERDIKEIKKNNHNDYKSCNSKKGSVSFNGDTFVEQVEKFAKE